MISARESSRSTKRSIRWSSGATSGVTSGVTCGSPRRPLGTTARRFTAPTRKVQVLVPPLSVYESQQAIDPSCEIHFPGQAPTQPATMDPADAELGAPGWIPWFRDPWIETRRRNWLRNPFQAQRSKVSTRKGGRCCHRPPPFAKDQPRGG